VGIEILSSSPQSARKQRNTYQYSNRAFLSGKSEMLKKTEAKKTTADMATITKIMRTVPSNEGFHFSKAPGDPTGKVATSLTDFAAKLRLVDIRSVNFHFPRQDFEKWLRNIIGDTELATRIGRIKRDTHGETLRNEIIRVVKGRVDELKGTPTKT
jgi:hypothetical protein